MGIIHPGGHGTSSRTASQDRRSIEEWHARCLYSQTRSDRARERALRRRARRKDVLVGLTVSLWAGAMLLAGYGIAHLLAS
jgi:hypothetical protein